MAELFWTADLHIGHRNVVIHANRGNFVSPNPNYDPTIPKNFKTNWPVNVDIEAHDNWIIDDVWNSVVGKKDHVIIAGDFIWKNHMKYLARLHGKKILIIGNHDKISQWFRGTFESAEWTFDAYVDADTETARKYPQQFSEIHTELHRTFDKTKRIIGSHCPYITWPGIYKGSYNIHGHCHGRLSEYEDTLRTDVGIDAWGRLVPHDILMKKMDSRYDAWKEKNRRLNDERPDGFQGSLLENRLENEKLFGTKITNNE